MTLFLVTFRILPTPRRKLSMSVCLSGDETTPQRTTSMDSGMDIDRLAAEPLTYVSCGVCVCRVWRQVRRESVLLHKQVCVSLARP